MIRRGIALTPVKFGISFTATWYNQAGALVHVYQDGSIHLNHGGTEMGQGLYTKVSQVLADEFQVDLDHVRVTATTTGKVPNTSATAASSGSDLNGMAAANAAHQIKERLVAFAAEKWGVPAEHVEFVPNHVRVGNHLVPFPELDQGRLPGARAALGGRLLQDAEDPLGPRGRQGPAVLLLRLRRRRVGGRGRHADRRIHGRAHRHPARRRPLAEPGDRPRPDRGRLRAGHGLAHHRGTVVGRQGPPPDPCAVDLQDPARLRPAEGLQRRARRLVEEPGGDHPPVEGRRRAALHAGDVGLRGAVDGRRLGRRLPRMPAPRRAGDARAHSAWRSSG